MKTAENNNKNIITLYELETCNNSYYWEDLTDELQEAGAVVCGNREFNTYNYIKNIDVSEIINDRKHCYINNEQMIEELEKATGKAYTVQTLRGYCQSDWIYIFYEKNTLTQQQISYIECIFFGKYEEYYTDDDSDDGCVYMVAESDYTTTEELKRVLAGQVGADVNAIQILKIDGYQQTPIYKEL